MAANRISYSLDDASFASIKAKIADITASMPFLVDLKQDKKKALPKFRAG